MIKVVWLCPYNVNNLLPELELNRKIITHNSSWIQNLSDSLALHPDLELHIITHSPAVNTTQHIIKNRIHFHVVKYNFPFTNKGFPKYLPYDRLSGYRGFARKARRIIAEIEPDVLHVHGTEGAYAVPALETQIPCIVSIQGIMSEYVKIEPSFQARIQAIHEQKAVKKATYFGCRTKFDYNFVRALNKDAVIFDLPEAMNTVFYQHQWKRPSDLSLLFVGSVNRAKGLEDLLHAMAKLKGPFPRLRLKVIGAGAREYLDHVNKMVHAYDLKQNISWLGIKSPKEIAVELSQSSFFVLPSLMDNSPNSLAEAMAVGVPSIATKVGGIPSMINDNVDGMLFEKHDVDALVAIIQHLVGNKELQDKLSTNARAKAQERNYPPRVARKYIDVYESLTK